MTIRTLRISAAALATVALVACNKPANTPAVPDSSAPANATPTVSTPTDSTVKPDSTAPKAKPDSAKPIADSAKPAK
jgi:hypothetical protein